MVNSLRIGDTDSVANREAGRRRKWVITRVPLLKVRIDLFADGLVRPGGKFRLRVRTVVADLLIQFVARDITLIDEELRDSTQPLLVVAELEVLERLHVFCAGP